MLRHTRKIGPFHYRRIWFAQESSWKSFFSFLSYRQFQGKKAPFGFIQRKFFTQLIDLTPSPEELLACMKKNTSYEIRRAEKEGTLCFESAGYSEFLEAFNKFAPTKNLSALTSDQMDALGRDLWITQAQVEGVTLVMHAYLLDAQASRGRLLYSATRVSSDGEPEVDRSVMGRANRALHWFDMVSLKARGIRIYDLGGVALKEGTDPTQGIDQFKMGFGGETVQEDHFDSPLLVMAQMITGKGA